MKISTTMSQTDWNNTLKKVWSLATDFEEILNFGLENNFITSSDIIHASDIYKDPNKEYDQSEIEEMVENSDLDDITNVLTQKYSIDKIIDSLPIDNILDDIDDYELLDALDGTWTLENHDDNIRSEYYEEVLNECKEELEQNNKEHLKNIQDWPADDLHKFICNIVGCSYYDSSVFDKLKDKLKNNSYMNYKDNQITLSAADR